MTGVTTNGDTGDDGSGATPDSRRTDVDWTEKYRPQRLADVVANGKATKTIEAWARSWQQGVPEKRALVLEGTPGIGKTSAAHALAKDMGWDLIELNASDARSGPVIERVAGQGATTNTFSATGEFRLQSEGRRTLIVLDEADNLFERGGAAAQSAGSDLSDRGGKRAIIDTVRKTRQPIILIVNDYYGLTKGSGAALRSLAETVKFQRVPARSVAKALANICKAEGVRAHPDALLRIAERAGGDMRAAVNDLQATARGRDEIQPGDVVGGGRDSARTIFDALPDVFKGTDLDRARKATWDLDENPETFVLWVDENIPIAYTAPDDQVRAFDRLSRADVFLGRVRRRQYYGLWSYASELMTGGVALAKHRTYKGWTRYQFPTWLRRMSSSKGSRGLRDGLARKVGRHLHTSMREARGEHLIPLQRLFQTDDEFAVHVGADLSLTPDELGLLLETKPSTKKVKVLHTAIQEELERRPRAHAGIWGTGDDPDAEPVHAGKGGTAKATPTKGTPTRDRAGADDKPAKGKRAAASPGPEAPDGADDQADADDAAGSTSEDKGVDDEKPAGQKGLFDF